MDDLAHGVLEVYLAKSNSINLLCKPLVVEGTPAKSRCKC